MVAAAVHLEGLKRAGIRQGIQSRPSDNLHVAGALEAARHPRHPRGEHQSVGYRAGLLKGCALFQEHHQAPGHPMDGDNGP